MKLGHVVVGSATFDVTPAVPVKVRLVADLINPPNSLVERSARFRVHLSQVLVGAKNTRVCLSVFFESTVFDEKIPHPREREKKQALSGLSIIGTKNLSGKI